MKLFTPNMRVIWHCADCTRHFYFKFFNILYQMLSGIVMAVEICQLILSVPQQTNILPGIFI